MKENRKNSLKRSLAVILFSILICLGVFIPQLTVSSGQAVTGSVQNMFAILSGLILGGLQGAGSAGFFIILGAAGLHVFPGKMAGMEYFLGPSGGYIWGYFFAALMGGMLLGNPYEYEKNFSLKHWLFIAGISFLCYATVYLPGILWFRHSIMENTYPEKTQILYEYFTSLEKNQRLKELLKITFYPFLGEDIVKWIITVPLTAVIRPYAAKILYPSDRKEEEAIFEDMKKQKELIEKLRNIKKTGNKKKN